MQHTSTVANGNGPRPEVEEVWATSSSFTSIAAAEDELLPQLLVHPHDNKNKLALILAGDHQQPLKAVPGLGNKIANWFYYSPQSYTILLLLANTSSTDSITTRLQHTQEDRRSLPESLYGLARSLTFSPLSSIELNLFPEF